MHSNPQISQSHEQYLTQRYNQGLSQLKSALNLSHIPVEIPPHVLVAKAVALLKFQFKEIHKVQQPYSGDPWDHPKYNKHQFENSHNSTKKASTVYYHDTRHFYKSKVENGASEMDTSKFCPSIQQTNDSDLMPPLHFEDGTDCNTVEIDNTLQKQTVNKLDIKCEPNPTSVDATGTNEFSSDWETSGAFSMLEDIDFDIPMDFHSNFM